MNFLFRNAMPTLVICRSFYPFVDQDLAMVKGILYFYEPQDYISKGFILPIGLLLVNKYEARGQTKRSRPPWEVQNMCTLLELGLLGPKPGPGLGVVPTDEWLVTGPPAEPAQTLWYGAILLAHHPQDEGWESGTMPAGCHACDGQSRMD